MFNMWEYSHGRGALVDGITVLRACCTAAQNSNELYELLQTLSFEQSCGVRSSVRTRAGRGENDVASFTRGIFVRQRFCDYIRSPFPQLEEATRGYGKREYFHAKYGLAKSSNTRIAHLQDTPSDEETTAARTSPKNNNYEIHLNTEATGS